ncbi:hypothetical protein [Nocardia sp. NBC_01388]|uniref:hypothetical protein n=1 Tax=Nocardia sp. NBC_01388 TaxID=2903596 RepID=UPI00324C1C27
MSEYQYYEFVAVDRPLTDRQLAQVRELSTRARITATRFVNEYHWGNFRGDPARMIERYYDAHLYVTNWGTHRFMIKLPSRMLAPDVAEQYCLDDQVTASISGEHLILDMTSDHYDGDWEEGAEDSLAALIGVRAELAGGDLRPLYLAWLAGYGTWEREEDVFDRDHDDEPEPPVPAGLRTLTAPQRALAEFLRLDPDLLHVAAAASPDLCRASDDPAALAAWISSLNTAEKNKLLLRVARGETATIHLELLHRFRTRTAAAAAPPSAGTRTVADLLDGAARHRAERERAAATTRELERARRDEALARARVRRLKHLAADGEQAWERVEALIATGKPRDYDAAAELLTDLRTLAENDSCVHEFDDRIADMRARHVRRPAFLRRLTTAGIASR